MTDRIKGFYVSLDRDIRDDDFEYIENAVLMLKGVLSVSKSVATPEDWYNRERIRIDMKRKIFDALKEEKK